MSSLKPIGNIVVICCAFFIIFGILGVQVSGEDEEEGGYTCRDIHNMYTIRADKEHDVKQTVSSSNRVLFLVAL